MPFTVWPDRMPLLKSSIELYKLTKVPSIFNKESVGWNLMEQMFVNL